MKAMRKPRYVLELKPPLLTVLYKFMIIIQAIEVCGQDIRKLRERQLGLEVSM
jgi:hypothetical protein